MDDRTMPLVTFRCPTCGSQQTERLTVFLRVAGRPDSTMPHPSCDGHPMTPIQYDYVH